MYIKQIMPPSKILLEYESMINSTVAVYLFTADRKT